MNTKHTPGPWTYSKGQGLYEQRYVIDSEPGRALAVCAGFEPRNEANARLIAAAPDLLEQLKAAQEMVFRYALSEAHKWTGDVSGSKAIEHAEKTVEPFRAAIAKATGETI